MSKKCGKCEKTVYPTEELKCLDKVWHKWCFKCEECGMTLNMRNYKGFDKKPYCDAHIPKAKATTVAETPELRRIAENTKLQSNVKYHAEFEKAKGKFTQVADDPETLRIRQNSKIISNVVYHGEYERKAAMEQKRSLKDEDAVPGVPIVDQEPRVQHVSVPAPQHPPQYQSKSSIIEQEQADSNSPYSARQHAHSTLIYSSQQGPATEPVHSVVEKPRMEPDIPAVSPKKVEPENLVTETPKTQPRPLPRKNSKTESHNSVLENTNVTENLDNRPTENFVSEQHLELRTTVKQMPTRRVGSIADYDPMNDQYGSLMGSNNNTNHKQIPRHQAPPYHPPPEPQQYHNHAPKGRVYRAMYDYSAGDYDEVSFHDGDLIVNTSPIDEGWMTGTVQRTGQTGMLPANYVEPAN